MWAYVCVGVFNRNTRSYAGQKKKKNPLFQRKSSGAQSVPQLTFPFSLPTGSITHMLDARNRWVAKVA